MSRQPSASRQCAQCHDLGKYRVSMVVRREGGQPKTVIRWITCTCRPLTVRVRLGKVIHPVPLMEPVDYPKDACRPMKRSECKGGPRPCPFVSCRFNNYLTVTSRGYISLTYEGREPDEVPPELSCAEDMADRARAGQEVTLEEIGTALGIRRERARQLVDLALAKLEMGLRARGIVRKDVDDE